MDESHIPDHLRHFPRICAQDTCMSKKVKWRYFNNKNVNQPRFKCEECGKYFTLGGTLRQKGKRRNRTEAEGEHAEHEDCTDTETTNRALNTRQALSPEPEVTPARVDHSPDASTGTSSSMELDDDIRESRRRPELVRDAIKANLLNSLKILVHVDLETDNESRERSRAQRDRGEQILHRIKNHVEVHLRRGEVLKIEHVFQAIQTMHAQTEAMDLGCFEASRMLMLVNSQQILKLVMELIPEFRIA